MFHIDSGPVATSVNNFTDYVQQLLSNFKLFFPECAQAQEILREYGSTHLPDCCENGNYAQLQCRLNECRCVDENGNQIVKEVYKEDLKQLKCYQENEKLCT